MFCDFFELSCCSGLVGFEVYCGVVVVCFGGLVVGGGGVVGFVVFFGEVVDLDYEWFLWCLV